VSQLFGIQGGEDPRPEGVRVDLDPREARPEGSKVRGGGRRLGPWINRREARGGKDRRREATP